MTLKARLKKLMKPRHGGKTDVFDRSFLMGDQQQQNGTANANANDGTSPAPTIAAFSPNQQTASRTKNQKSILIHQKSPLLIATPPQVTRALAYSHPFILPLNHIAGLLSWTTDDPWESFLLLSAFWFVVLYGDPVLRWAGPVVLVAGLIMGMYSRRYSPLSSTTWSGIKHKRQKSDSEQQRKSLDEILDTLQTFTNRCDVLLDPFLRLTEYLSTQSSATSATTRPALTALFIRILAFTPVWILLTLPPLRIITTQRLILTLGTIGLSWHSRPTRITRTILWRSRTIRRALSLLTGLNLPSPTPTATSDKQRPPPAPRAKAAASKGKPPGGAPIRFTFTIYQNQRRWWMLGWTSSMLAYERQAWTDDQLNECPEPESYTLPETENATTKWRWVKGSEWHVEGATTEKEKSAKRIGGGGGGDFSGWVYYDNKWQDGRKEDGWGRYTRRRKWVRDAELVEIDAADEAEAEATPITPTKSTVENRDFAETSSIDSTGTSKQRKGWFNNTSSPSNTSAPNNTVAKLSKRPPHSRQHSKNVSISSVDGGDTASTRSRAESTMSRGSQVEEDVHTPLERTRQYDWDRSINESVAMQLS